MDDLSARELFLNTINFKSSPKTLKWEFGYWGGAINRWYSEGLPKNIGMSKELTSKWSYAV